MGRHRSVDEDGRKRQRVEPWLDKLGFTPGMTAVLHREATGQVIFGGGSPPRGSGSRNVKSEEESAKAALHRVSTALACQSVHLSPGAMENGVREWVGERADALYVFVMEDCLPAQKAPPTRYELFVEMERCKDRLVKRDQATHKRELTNPEDPTLETIEAVTGRESEAMQKARCRAALRIGDAIREDLVTGAKPILELVLAVIDARRHERQATRASCGAAKRASVSLRPRIPRRLLKPLLDAFVRSLMRCRQSPGTSSQEAREMDLLLQDLQAKDGRKVPIRRVLGEWIDMEAGWRDLDATTRADELMEEQS